MGYLFATTGCGSGEGGGVCNRGVENQKAIGTGWEFFFLFEGGGGGPRGGGSGGHIYFVKHIGVRIFKFLLDAASPPLPIAPDPALLLLSQIYSTVNGSILKNGNEL